MESGHGRVGDVLRSCNGVGVAGWLAVVGKDGGGAKGERSRERKG